VVLRSLDNRLLDLPVVLSIGGTFLNMTSKTPFHTMGVEANCLMAAPDVIDQFDLERKDNASTVH
jgi:hypothetical protein